MDRTALLRTGLVFNAAFSTLCAAFLLSEPARFAPELAMPDVAMQMLGGSLAVFVVWLLFQATRPRMRLLDVRLTTAADAGWVVGSALLLWAWPDITPTGVRMVCGVALVVGLAAVLQYVGLQRVPTAPDPARGPHGA